MEGPGVLLVMKGQDSHVMVSPYHLSQLLKRVIITRDYSNWHENQQFRQQGETETDTFNKNVVGFIVGTKTLS